LKIKKGLLIELKVIFLFLAVLIFIRKYEANGCSLLKIITKIKDKNSYKK